MISFNKFSKLTTFICARAIVNLFCIYLRVNILSLSHSIASLLTARIIELQSFINLLASFLPLKSILIFANVFSVFHFFCQSLLFQVFIKLFLQIFCSFYFYFICSNFINKNYTTFYFSKISFITTTFSNNFQIIVINFFT